ncbi:hypothetical protein IKX73_01695 [Candidatus Saccharibacteria bacterium]|nr:hypothetical protein [Candidatus Saccharibacteria bacterium]
MVESLKEHDPYNEMNTGEKGIRPDFLKENDKKKEAADALLGAEKDASSKNEGTKGDGGLAAMKKAEVAGGFYRGGGKAEMAIKGAKALKGGKSKAIILVVLGILLIPIIGIIIIAGPQLLIGQIDYNLMGTLGFDETVAILEEQSEYVTAEMMAKGEFPSGYASDLATNGLLVGQVTAAGQFVRTNNYIANIEDLKDIAATGDHFAKTSDGELAILYDNKVITASDFVLAVESDSRMYADFADAVDISTRYYYSNAVNEIYKRMGFTRDAFKNWESTGDSKKDEEEFYKILNKMLDDSTDLALSGYDLVLEYTGTCPIEVPDPNNEGKMTVVMIPCDPRLATYLEDVTNMDASVIISGVASRTEDNTVPNATDKAAQLLNSAVSAGEPYLAASAFMAIEEPIQRARAGDNGPVNEVMNALTKQTEVEYDDVNTGKTVKTKKSILETKNFVAAVSDGIFNKDEANNFSRDRIVKATNRISDYATRDTIVSPDDRKNQGVLTIMNGNEKADTTDLVLARSSLNMAIVEKNSDLFSSEVGGNRVLAGGSFINNEINRQVIAAMPSDKGTIMAYNQEVEKVLARKANADRAKKSPFDISSPYTFMGSLVRKMGAVMIKNIAITRVTSLPIVNTVADLTGNAVAGLFGIARAEGEEDKFTTISGDCTTINSAAKVEGDLYCTSHGTASIDYMHYTEEDWIEAGVINRRGIESDGMKDFIKYGMDRGANVGVMSADVCTAYAEEHGSIFVRIWKGILTFLGLGDLYNACKYTPQSIATGAAYTLSGSNSNVGSIKLYSGYALYDTVSSLLKEKQSRISAFREEYYAEHPLDNSTAGRIARISGMTKNEAQIALNYAAALVTIAQYNASERYAFNDVIELVGDDDLMFGDAEIMMASYALLLDKMSFADVRNRTNLV